VGDSLEEVDYDSLCGVLGDIASFYLDLHGKNSLSTSGVGARCGTDDDRRAGAWGQSSSCLARGLAAKGGIG